MAGRGQADVVVIGADAAGARAAIEAAAAGAHTIVLEAFAEPSGAAAWSGGGVFLVGTPAERQQGIRDSAEVADWMRCGGEETDAAWAYRYIIGCAELGAWLMDRGVSWDAVLDDGEGNSVPRWHAAGGGGAGLMRALLESAVRASIEWRFDTPRPGSRLGTAQWSGCKPHRRLCTLRPWWWRPAVS